MEARKLRNLLTILKEFDVQAFSDDEVNIDLRKNVEPKSVNTDDANPLKDFLDKNKTAEELAEEKRIQERMADEWSTRS